MPVLSKFGENKFYLQIKEKIHNSPLFASWRTIVFSCVAVALLVFVLTKLDFIFFWNSLKQLSFLEFSGLLFISLFEFFLASARYNLMGGFKIFSYYPDYVSTTTIERTIPPRPLGLYYRFLLTSSLYKTEVKKTIFLIFVDSVFDLIPLLFGIIALMFVPAISTNFEFRIILYIIAVIGAAYLFYAVYENYQYAKRSIILQKLTIYLIGVKLKLKESLLEFLHVNRTYLFFGFLLTLLRFVANVSKVYFLFLIFGLDISFWQVLIIYSIAYLVGSSSSLPGGIGAFELTFMLVAKDFGIGSEIALTIAILERIFSVWLWLLLSGVYLANLKVGLFNSENWFLQRISKLSKKVSKHTTRASQKLTKKYKKILKLHKRI